MPFEELDQLSPTSRLVADSVRPRDDPPEHVHQIETEFTDWQRTLRIRPPFHVGLDHLHRYAEAHGSSSSPYDATIDGFPIGAWSPNAAASIDDVSCRPAGSPSARQGSPTGNGA
ncbi:hypothetical protein CA982_24870 [Gordonia lacunae]|uniref:Uncharacterized protein n=1 Tax=Gordonia lacunae TaxID=417102 RepID=A0A243Q3F5_9ACTN|nr:hypothetical protein CA982_24870 [Gordonia lacunae]